MWSSLMYVLRAWIASHAVVFTAWEARAWTACGFADVLINPLVVSKIIPIVISI